MIIIIQENDVVNENMQNLTLQHLKPIIDTNGMKYCNVIAVHSDGEVKLLKNRYDANDTKKLVKRAVDFFDRKKKISTILTDEETA